MMTMQHFYKKNAKRSSLQERLKSAENSMRFGIPATGLSRDRQATIRMKFYGNEKHNQLNIFRDSGI